ncbi:CFEM domain-containing protein [Aspergillus lucknowensis]|uniref:CFEM domain-containing protein n=1 Tax=Aspergillus lucknowensis TaxID=176173 RepID=A0ABR4M1G9_9EURO
MSHDGCSSLTDFACHCRQPALVSEVTPCVQQSCNVQDQSSVSNAVTAECSSVGVPISIPPVTGSTTQSNPTTSEETEPAAPTTGSSPGHSGPVVTLPTPNPPMSPSSTAVTSSSVAPSTSAQNSPSDSTSPSPPFVGGAVTPGPSGAFAGVAAAAVAGYLL